MKITVFTGNQPRHIHLINSLSGIADEVYAVQECNTVFPGKIKDFYNNSPTMQDYFSRVMRAEKNVFGDIEFTHKNARTISIKTGDINFIELETLNNALQSDFYIVFGASYIKGNLIEFLVKNKAINIHIGVSPFYRGSSCNFWASYDKNYHFVGATIHLLSKGLDSGDILFHALPRLDYYEPFDLGMYAVKAAHNGIADMIQHKKKSDYIPMKQDRIKEIRYTRNSEFTDEIAKLYLEYLPSSLEIYETLKTRDCNQFIKPFISEFK